MESEFKNGKNEDKPKENATENLEEKTDSNHISNEEKGKPILKRFKYSYNDLVRFMYTPTHPASLAFTRILFGLLILVDIIDERGGAYIDLRWGEPKNCYFPLFPQLIRPPLPWMCVLYGIMWLGALGITLGYRFKISCVCFVLPYWYILLLEKSFWNNHSYLFGLVGILFLGTSANNYWSLDVVLKNVDTNLSVPRWNYFILKFQFFILYFFAGLKKTDMEWLEGYSMLNLGSHWVFKPFTLILHLEAIDYLIVHMSGFLLDLSLGFLLLCSKTRPLALLFGGMFHVMNTRLFSIGMFPYVCLASMPIFCDPDWPLKLIHKLINKLRSNKTTEILQQSQPEEKFSYNHHLTIFLIFLHCCLQIFLPYSHFITKGYNNWTNGLYGYSWDMMVHSWDTSLVVVRVVDNKTGKEHFLDPDAWTNNDRWSKHADMCVQYAHCLKKNLLNETKNEKNSQISEFITSENLSIYIDVWCSLNGRFQQRMYNPNYDLLKANWSPFEKVEWLLPLLTEYSGLRETMREIQEHVYTWSNYSDVLFIADFPGLYLENFITPELINVTLTVIEGEVYFEPEDNYGVKLKKGSSIPIVSDVFHRIYTISEVPSCFMYTYTNKTRENLNEETNKRFHSYSPIPLLEDGEASVEGFLKMLDLIGNSILNIIYEVPMVRRTQIY